MRKLTVALLFVIAILLAGRFWQELNSIANAGDNDPISTILNGDVNGDQILDMSDAVYLLIHLFNGGPDPVAFGDTPEMLDRVARLEERIERILTPEERAILEHLSLVDLEDGQGGLARTVRLTGANLQVVNGLGATNGNPENPTSNAPELTETNGLGNIIVGYHEPRSISSQGVRTGSHNLVVGNQHNFASYGGLVGGVGNHLEAPYGSIPGGSSNWITDVADESVDVCFEDVGVHTPCLRNYRDVTGWAFDTSRRVLYALKRDWLTYDTEIMSYSEESALPDNSFFRGTEVEIPEGGMLIKGLAYDSRRNRLYTNLYGPNPNGLRQLRVLDPDTGELGEVVVADLIDPGGDRNRYIPGPDLYHPNEDAVYFFEEGNAWRVSLADGNVSTWGTGLGNGIATGDFGAFYNPEDDRIYLDSFVCSRSGDTVSGFYPLSSDTRTVERGDFIPVRSSRPGAIGGGPRIWQAAFNSITSGLYVIRGDHENCQGPRGAEKRFEILRLEDGQITWEWQWE